MQVAKLRVTHGGRVIQVELSTRMRKRLLGVSRMKTREMWGWNPAARGGPSSNMRVSPPHSAVTALAQIRKRRAAGRAGYAQR